MVVKTVLVVKIVKPFNPPPFMGAICPPASLFNRSEVVVAKDNNE
jgi:hypothetical protein